MVASLNRRTSVIWWTLVLSGMVMSCSTPVREADRTPATVQDSSVATDKQEKDAVQSYLGFVFQSIEGVKMYPSIMAQSGLSRRVVLRFTVRRDGEIVDPQITEVSGHESFGNAALHTLKRIGQLPPFPDEIRRRELLVEVPITYRSAVDLSAGAGATGTTRDLFFRWAMNETEAAMEEAKAAMERGYSSTLAFFAAFQPLITKLQSLAEEGDAHSQEFLAAMQRSYAELGVDADAFKAFLTLISGNQQTETWRCFKLFDRYKATALFSLIRMRIGGKEIGGEVSVAGTAHAAQFQVGGLNRRWDWDCDGKTGCRYAFSIRPDGTGTFYDFSVSEDGRAKPSQVFECQLSP